MIAPAAAVIIILIKANYKCFIHASKHHISDNMLNRVHRIWSFLKSHHRMICILLFHVYIFMQLVPIIDKW
jgi:hypothetical protein